MFKSKFNILFESIMKDLYSEGGIAMANHLTGSDLEKLTRINKENVKPTLDFIKRNILDKLEITDDMWTAELGSTGKKSTSGDIDIAIRMDILQEKLGMSDLKEVRTFILNKLNEFGFPAVQHGDMINWACPIQGTQNDGSLIQVDFFTSPDLEYTKLQKFSPSEEESQYKGLHRTELWRAIMKSCSIEAIENAPDYGDFIAPDGRHYPAKQFKHLLMMDDGFWMISKSWLGAKGNINKHEVKDILPRQFMGRDFQVILNMLFGTDKYHISDLQSFETIWNNILMDPTFPYLNKVEDIVTTFYYECIKKHVDVPAQVQEYIDKHGLLY